MPEADNYSVDSVSIVDPNFDEDTVSPLPSSLAQQLIDRKPFSSPQKNCNHSRQGSDTDSDAGLSGDFTDSPEALGFGPAGTSSISSQSSLSGVLFHSSPSNSGSTSSQSLAYLRDTQSHTGSTNFSLRSTTGKSSKSELRRLKSQASKFASRHNAGKANFLRLTLLPFLRRHQMGVVAPAAKELALAHKVFALWWEKLLDVFKSNFKHVNGVDRDAFAEAISSLMSRPEWLDYQMQQPYESLLAHTTHCVLSRSAATRALTISQSAFTGKVLGYAYNYLPGFAGYLLQFMEVSPSAVDRIMASLAGGLLSADSPCFASIPAHLTGLIGSTVLENHKPVRSFGDNYQGWERHFTVGSAIFASFFKHYCMLQSQNLPVDHRADTEFLESDGMFRTVNYWESVVLSTPGMILILAAVVNNLEQASNDLCRQIGPRNSNPYAYRHTSSSSSIPGRQGTQIPLERGRADQLKIFASLRDVLHSDDNTVPYFLAFSRTFDRIFRAVAMETQVYDMKRCVAVCDIADEWFASLLCVNTTKSSSVRDMYANLMVDWSFWLQVAKRMLTCDNCHTKIRAVSFLFNLWPYIPNTDSKTSSESFSSDSSVLWEVTKWILSPEIWYHMFCHWSPLVRSYYQRFLCYRIASVGNASTWYLDVDTSQYIAESREILKMRLAETYLWCQYLEKKTGMKPELSPSLPMPRLRVGIRGMGLPLGLATKPEANLTRVYPFDVYDSVAYLQSDFGKEETVHPAPSSSSSFKSTVSTVKAAESINTDKPESVYQSEGDVAKNVGSSGQSSAGVTSKMEDFDFSEADGEGSDQVSTNDSPSPSQSPSQSPSRTPSSQSRSQSPQHSPLESSSSSLLQPTINLQPPKSPQGSTTQSTLKMSPRTPAKSPKSTLSTPSSVSPKSSPLSFFRKLLPHRKTSPGVDSSRDGNQRLDDPFGASGSSETPQKARSLALPPPPQLTELRPDVVRAPFKFTMVPTPIRPPMRSDLAIPRLPFSPDFGVQNYAINESGRTPQMNLSMWNYGGRSLAEWSIEVICFERFAQDQRRTTLEMFPMPFMITEIPWRTIG